MDSGAQRRQRINDALEGLALEVGTALPDDVLNDLTLCVDEVFTEWMDKVIDSE